MKRIIFVFALSVTTAAIAAPQILLLWNPSPGTNATGYKVYQQVGTNGWTAVGFSSSTNFVAKLAEGLNQFRVTATNAVGMESVPSNTIQATGLIPPTGLVLNYVPITDAITISWAPNPPQDAVTSYNVYEVYGGTNFVKLTSQTGLAYAMARQPGNHFYCLTAVNGDGESPFSTVVSYAEVLPPGLLSKQKYP